MPQQQIYDVVIVGGGLSGSIIASELVRQKIHVLMLEAGGDEATTLTGYRRFVQNFYAAEAKITNSPYPDSPFARHPDVLDKLLFGTPGAEAHYMVQRGRQPFRSSYARALGGTMLHWLGSCFRLLPNDFRTNTEYGHGRDWPLSYTDLMHDYERAEREIGVSGDVDDQLEHGLSFVNDEDHEYVYPMEAIPQSYLDLLLKRELKELNVLGKTLHVRSTPQGRNGNPNPKYLKIYPDVSEPPPVGSVRHHEFGQRCQGSASCVPICPIQAKYNPVKTLIPLLQRPGLKQYFTLRTHAVAAHIRHKNGRVIGIDYYDYAEADPPKKSTVQGRVYVLAAHAVENAKLLLASGLETTSGLVGKNLMDHPVMLAWARMPKGKQVGSYRGPGVTSTIPAFCDGDFRRKSSAFRIELSNWGWNWAKQTPYSTVADLLKKRKFGVELRRAVHDLSGREIQLQFMMEQLPAPTNRVTVEPQRFVDKLGIPRPVIHYDFDDYLRGGRDSACKVANAIFDHLQACDRDIAGADNKLQGAGHFGGTHVMGKEARNSVVDEWQRSHDYKNLYIVGSGSFPTMGSSNPSLTIAALAFRSARFIAQEFRSPVKPRGTQIEQLRQNLQDALRLEHSTIPPYLCALYTITPETNLAAFDIINSVVMEEMLHMALVANVLIAIGGRPDFSADALMRPYPFELLPKSRIKAELLPFGKDALETFLAIENPGRGQRKMPTIGRFYRKIEAAILDLSDDAFVGDDSWQVGSKYYYGPSKLITVKNRDDALKAIRLIKDQGEGERHTVWSGDTYHGWEQEEEPAHYFRFRQLLDEKYYVTSTDHPLGPPSGKACLVDWDSAIPMYPNPRLSHYRDGTPLRLKAEAFNREYAAFLGILNQAFNGEPAKMKEAIHKMFALKQLFLALLRQPHPRDRKQRAGPTFEKP
jgi:choline dehydrogenase-like flavoprotein